ncbi:MAG: radical SAM protein [Candidatus Goldiibacteriota bacterium]
MYTPKGIVLVPTYDCTAMCRHCNNDFYRHDLSIKMDPARAVEILKEAKIAGLNSLQFTGGELTLYPEFMPQIIPHARKMAMRINRPPTNCYIGAYPDKARIFFSAMKKAGFSSGFRISIDNYHQKKIPLESVVQFVFIYSEYFPLNSLTIGSCCRDLDEIMPLYEKFIEGLKKHGMSAEINKEKKSIYINDKRVKYGTWRPTRPSWKPIADEEAHMAPIKKTVHCLGPDGLAYLWVEPDFKVRVCSCNGNGFTDYLVVGDLSRERVADVIARVKKDKIFAILADYGPAGLRDVINKDKEVLDTAKEYSFMCELCREILNNSELVETIKMDL